MEQPNEIEREISDELRRSEAHERDPIRDPSQRAEQVGKKTEEGDVEASQPSARKKKKENLELPLFSTGREVVCYLCMTVLLPIVVVLISFAVQELGGRENRWLVISTRLTWSGLIDSDSVGTQLCAAYREELPQPGACKSSMNFVSGTSERRRQLGDREGEGETEIEDLGVGWSSSERRRASERFSGTAIFDISLSYSRTDTMEKAKSSTENLASQASSGDPSDSVFSKSVVNRMKKHLNIGVNEMTVTKVRGVGRRGSFYGDSFFLTNSAGTSSATTSTTTTTSTFPAPHFDVAKWSRIYHSNLGVGWGEKMATGDLNGDGVEDIILSAKPAGTSLYVIFGGSTLGNFDMNTIDGSNGFSITADSAFVWGDVTNCLVAADINGDGIDDLIMSDGVGDYAGLYGGDIYVFFGRKTWDASYTFGQYDVFIRSSRTLNMPPPSCAACDVDGDGKADIVVGDDGTDRVSILYGRTKTEWETVSSTTTAFYEWSSTEHNLHLQTVTANVRVGQLVGCQDVDGDGLADVFVSTAHRNGANYAVVTLITGLSGKPLGSSDLLSSNLKNTLDVNSVQSFRADELYRSSSGDIMAFTGIFPAGDVNGDGKMDVVFGASNYCTDCSGTPTIVGGAAYLVYGGLDGITNQESGTLQVSVTKPSPLSFLQDDNPAGDVEFGISATKFWDLDGDGLNELVVCSRGRSVCYIGYSSNLKSPGVQTLSESAGRFYHSNWGQSNSIKLGTAFLIADVTGDAIPDAIISAPAYNGEENGEVFFYKGIM